MKGFSGVYHVPPVTGVVLVLGVTSLLMAIWFVVAVCWFVSRIKQKLLDGFPQHLNGGSRRH